jgi:rhomboid protease GluP
MSEPGVPTETGAPPWDLGDEFRSNGGRPRPRRRSFPWLTFFLIGINLLVFAAGTVLGGLRWYEGAALLIFLGAKENSLIHAGQYWRLVTPNFLHIGYFHLVSNMMGLLFLGALVEAFYGRARYFLIYMLSGVAGFALSYMLQPTLSAGASAAVFGLAGAMVVHNVRYRAYLPPDLFQRMSLLVPLIILNIALSLVMPQIDLWGHLGGLLCGVFLGLITESRIAGEFQGEREALPLPAALATAAALALYGIVGWGFSAPREWPLAQGGRAELRGQFAAATNYYQAALQREPQLNAIRQRLAALLASQGRVNEANLQELELVRRNAAKGVTPDEYLQILDGVCAQLAQAGRWREVADRYREAVRLAPNAARRAEYQNDLAYVLADNLQENLAEAKELATAATKAEPENAMYLDTLAWVHYRLKEYPEAERVQEQALQAGIPGRLSRGGENPVIRYHMGAIREALGKKEAAVADYRQALELCRHVSAAEAREALGPSQAALRRLTGQG